MWHQSHDINNLRFFFSNQKLNVQQKYESQTQTQTNHLIIFNRDSKLGQTSEEKGTIIVNFLFIVDMQAYSNNWGFIVVLVNFG